MVGTMLVRRETISWGKTPSMMAINHGESSSVQCNHGATLARYLI